MAGFTPELNNLQHAALHSKISSNTVYVENKEFGALFFLLINAVSVCI